MCTVPIRVQQLLRRCCAPVRPGVVNDEEVTNASIRRKIALLAEPVVVLAERPNDIRQGARLSTLPRWDCDVVICREAPSVCRPTCSTPSSLPRTRAIHPRAHKVCHARVDAKIPRSECVLDGLAARHEPAERARHEAAILHGQRGGEGERMRRNALV